MKGTFISILQFCKKCNSRNRWDSQPFINNIPAGNLLLSCGTFVNGLPHAKMLRFLKSINIASISSTTLQNHITNWMQPTIHHIWLDEQDKILSFFKGMESSLVLCGDGRADSPGHSAKYGTYTFIDARLNKIVDMQLVQVFIKLLK